jgi:anion-transporting  ArsA/GET3 family ATPase
VDPARRLADALGVEVGTETSRVTVGDTSMDARMPDSRRSVESFADWLFADQPRIGAKVRKNPLYRELADALVGMHEMASVTIVEQELQTGRYDEVILDTAPTRHALEFLDCPARLAEMLEARTVRWVAAMATRADPALADSPPSRGVVAWGKRRVQALLGSVAGDQAIRDVSALFEDLLAVRGRWLELLRSVERRFAAEATRHWVVCTPTTAAIDDAQHLLRELERRGRVVHRVLLNRSVRAVPSWLTDLDARGDSRLRAIQQAMLEEYRARARQTRAARRRLGPDVPLAGLPAWPSSDPRAILVGLADALGEILRR